MTTEPTYAFGVLLRMTTTEEGGRSSPLPGGCGPDAPSAYRADWRLPGMDRGTVAMGPVFGFSRSPVAPGDVVRAVVVAGGSRAMRPLWARVDVGDELAMHEGARVCGVARVLWRHDTALPLPDADGQRFTAWLQGPDGSALAQ